MEDELFSKRVIIVLIIFLALLFLLIFYNYIFITEKITEKEKKCAELSFDVFELKKINNTEIMIAIRKNPVGPKELIGLELIFYGKESESKIIDFGIFKDYQGNLIKNISVGFESSRFDLNPYFFDEKNNLKQICDRKFRIDFD